MFKRVPALDKCFSVLELLASRERPFCISEIARALGYSKSTVYNMLHTLVDLEVLEPTKENTFRFGARLYAIGKSAGNGSELISTVHPYLEEMIKKARQEGFAFDDEEYIEGVRALAVPLRFHRARVQAAIWMVGLRSQIKDEDLPLYRSMLEETAKKIETRFSME